MYRNNGSDFFSGILMTITVFFLAFFAIKYLNIEFVAVCWGLAVTGVALTVVRS